jgi:histidinol-phosphate aminotransferase
MTPLPSPNAAFVGLEAYHSPRHPAPVDLLLNSNEGPPPPPELMRAALENTIGALHRYPTTAPLEQALTTRFGLRPGSVLVTAGADEAIDRAFRTFLGPGRELVLPTPTFVMMHHYARLVGCEVRTVPWPDAVFPEASVMAAINPATAAIACVTPNNPTGAIIAPEIIRRVAHAAPHAVILVDLAYAEFAARDPMAELGDLDNALFFRTFSKAWGLAGARVGYVIARPDIIRWLRAAASPYSVPSPSVALALAWLEHGEGLMRERVAQVAAERTRLQQKLTELGIRTVASEANFVFATFPTAAHATWCVDALAGLGIAVRGFAGHPQLGRSVRITCPGEATACTRLVHALDAALAPRARIVEDTAALEKAAGAPIWYYSARPENLGRARSAGAVPIALAPDANPDLAASLYAAGAARIVADPASHEESLL